MALAQMIEVELETFEEMRGVKDRVWCPAQEGDQRGGNEHSRTSQDRTPFVGFALDPHDKRSRQARRQHQSAVVLGRSGKTSECPAERPPANARRLFDR